eukprot:1106491-Rhodomonas_salina.1
MRRKQREPREERRAEREERGKRRGERREREERGERRETWTEGREDDHHRAAPVPPLSSSVRSECRCLWCALTRRRTCSELRGRGARAVSR